MDNPFEALAEQQLTAPVKARMRASEKRAAMKPTPQEQESINQQRQLRLHAKWRRARTVEHLERPHPAEHRELKAMLQSMTIGDGQRLVDYVSRATWLTSAPYMTRAVALALIDHSIVRLRLRNGYPPFDDSLPGEAPSAFELIRDILKCFPTEPPCR